METKRFSENEIPSQNREAQQPEKWQEARKAMRENVKHFTAEQDTGYSYGYTWHHVVKEYLKTGYKAENCQHEVKSLGVLYKVLKREEVTAFYDADGNTLFDVTNERLEREYELLAKNTAAEAALHAVLFFRLKEYPICRLF